MKKLLVALFTLFVIINLNPEAVEAKGKKKAKKILACRPGPGYQTCLNRVNNAVDNGQDRSIRRLEKKIWSMKSAQAKLAKAAELDSAIERIVKLEEFRKSLPSDIVGKEEITRMIREAAAANNRQIGQEIQALNDAITARIDGLEARIDQLTERVERVEYAVEDVEERIDTVEDNLYRRAIRFEMFGAGIASNGVLGGGIGGGLLLPLGQTGRSFFRGDVWFGMAEQGFASGGQMAIDWWLGGGWLAIGPALVYSVDKGKNTGVQSLVAGLGPDFRFEFGRKSAKFMFSITPFVGVAGKKPSSRETVGIGANFLLGVGF